MSIFVFKSLHLTAEDLCFSSQSSTCIITSIVDNSNTSEIIHDCNLYCSMNGSFCSETSYGDTLICDNLNDLLNPNIKGVVFNSSSVQDLSDTWLKQKGLHVIHLNGNHVYPKLDEVKLLLQQNINTDLQCLGEPCFE